MNMINENSTRSFIWNGLIFHLAPVHWAQYEFYDQHVMLRPRLENTRMLLEDFLKDMNAKQSEELYADGQERDLCAKIGHLRPLKHRIYQFNCLLCGVNKDVAPGYDGAFVTSTFGDPEKISA